jgi:hypothetical protein
VRSTAFKNFLGLGLRSKRCNIESKSKAQVSQDVAADNCALRPASFSWGSMNNEAFLKNAKIKRSPNSIHKRLIVKPDTHIPLHIYFFVQNIKVKK